MTTQGVNAGSPSNTLRRVQEVADGDNDSIGAGSGSLRTVDMSFLSNATSYVDDSGVGHVKANDSMDWSDILPNDSTVHIIYEGSGSTEEILIIPVNDTAPKSTESSSSSSSGSGSMAGNSSVVDNLPTGSSDDSSSGDSVGVIGTGSSSTTLVIVASVLAIIAIAAICAVVMYGRRNRRRAYSEDPSNHDEPFIVGSLPHQPAPQLSMLDTDITPDLWVEGQYQYSPNMSGLENSLSGTAILSDNNTTSLDHRLTVDAYPFGPNTKRGRRYNIPLEPNSQRSHRNNAPLDDISDRGRYRRGTTPVVLYEEDSMEEYQTNSSRKNHSQRRTSQRHRPSSQQHRHQRHRESLQLQRISRRDKYATRRDRR
ncbi:hypothetical protein F441_06644 [Phytophthora nicotianae CJ01A1]|uniref:Uncharacterized protein n=2 Tax=Phytophthora nicotianae TaxID=4792 RepID=W2XAE8_PHYNI|nr:hypothetical protein L915_06511 [Phytophthora nicotianae]ETP19348.1 hypothetical protein F441_06644 [Phytophthora nicotianae CJ01A1]